MAVAGPGQHACDVCSRNWRPLAVSETGKESKARTCIHRIGTHFCTAYVRQTVGVQKLRGTAPLSYRTGAILYIHLLVQWQMSPQYAGSCTGHWWMYLETSSSGISDREHATKVPTKPTCVNKLLGMATMCTLDTAQSPLSIKLLSLFS